MSIGLLFLAGEGGYALQISQIEFDLHQAAGSAGTYSFKVINNESQAQEIKVYLSDWTRTSTGENDFIPLNGARWLFLRSFSAGEEMEILYQVLLTTADLTAAGSYISGSPAGQGKVEGVSLLSAGNVGVVTQAQADDTVSITREIVSVTPAGDSLTVRLHIRILQDIVGLRIDEIFSSHAQIESIDLAGGEFEAVNRSNGDWITVTPQRFQIEAGQVQDVTFQLDVPVGTEGVYWGMIFVEGSPRPQEQAGATVLAIERFGVKVYETVPGTEELAGKITQVRKTADDPLTFEIRFENMGNIQLRPTGMIDIISQNGETVRNIRIEEFPLLPGKVRIFSVVDTTKPLLTAGIYRALVTIDYGGDNIAGGTRDFRLR
jgi:hypothetical protein